MSDRLCHTASIQVGVPAEQAFAFMADGMKQGEWAFGSWQRRQVGDDLFVGSSLFSGREVYVRLTPEAERMLVHYAVGPDPEHLLPRVIGRVVPGAELGLGADCCVVTLVLWRAAEMSDGDWQMLRSAHEAEMFVIRRLIEAEN